MGISHLFLQVYNMSDKILGFRDSDETEQLTKEDLRIFLDVTKNALNALYLAIPSAVR